MNARKLADYRYSVTGLCRTLSEELTKVKGKLAQLVEYLKSIQSWASSTSTLAIGVRASSWSSTKRRSLGSFKGTTSWGFRQIIAYSYDNLRSLKFVVSGSEVGLLYKFFDFESYESPLYGRAWDEVVLERFTREKSIDFLEAGFAEAGLRVPRERLESAVDALNGIPGWLALYGYEAVKRRRADVLDEVLERAVGTALSELKNLVATSHVYRYVLKAVAMGHASWSNVRRALEAWLGAQVHSETLSRCLSRLVDMSVLVKKDGEYRFSDPMYREAALRL